MKKYLFIILFFAAIVNTSCYKDLGNYHYRFQEMNDLSEISFNPEAFISINGMTIEFQQPLERDTVQRIEVSLTQTLAKNFDNLDFLWKYSYIKEGKNVTDTAFTKGYLDLPLFAGRETQYSVLLEIKDRTTTLAKYAQVRVKTRPIFQNSLFVLHGNKIGNMLLGNIEFFGNESIVRTDAFKTVSELANPFVNALGFGYSAYNTDGNRESTNLCVFSNDGTARVYHPFGLTPKFSPNYALPPTQDNNRFIFQRMVENGNASNQTNYKLAIARDGKFLVGRTYMAFHNPYNGDDSETQYRITAGTITDQHYLLWDALNNRFLYISKQDEYVWDEADAPSIEMKNPVLDANVDFSLLGANLSPVGKQAVYAYINHRENFSDAHPFFIFRDVDTDKYFLYELTPTLSDDKGGSGSDEPAFSIAAKELRNFDANVNLSTVLYNSWFTTNYIFYAKDGNVFRYNTSDGDRKTIYSAPEGYTVSVMKFRSNDSGSFSGNLEQYLSIGLNKGAEGAITEIKLTTAADLDEEFTPVFFDRDEKGIKFGNIKDLQFAHLYLYELPDYMK